MKKITRNLRLIYMACTYGCVDELVQSVITTRVKYALLADPDVKSLDIGVETFKREVQLSGLVKD